MDLNIFPYKVSVGQPFSSNAIQRRYGFACQLDAMMEDKSINPRDIIFSNEAHFWLSGYVNQQNYCFRGSQKPEMVLVRPLQSENLTVWAAFRADGIIGPFF